MGGHPAHAADGRPDPQRRGANAGRRRADHATHNCASVCPDRPTDVSTRGRANVATHRCADCATNPRTGISTHDAADFSASRCTDHVTHGCANCAPDCRTDISTHGSANITAHGCPDCATDHRTDVTRHDAPPTPPTAAPAVAPTTAAATPPAAATGTAARRDLCQRRRGLAQRCGVLRLLGHRRLSPGAAQRRSVRGHHRASQPRRHERVGHRSVPQARRARGRRLRLDLRAQAPLDGSNQGGRYYVFEVGDRGEVGAWRREQNAVDRPAALEKSEAVHAGAAENRLQVLAAGPQFTFSVNDTPVDAKVIFGPAASTCTRFSAAPAWTASDFSRAAGRSTSLCSRRQAPTSPRRRPRHAVKSDAGSSHPAAPGRAGSSRSLRLRARPARGTDRDRPVRDGGAGWRGDGHELTALRGTR